MPKLTTKDFARLEDVLWKDLGLSPKKLLQSVKKGLKATKLYGKDAVEHPDFTERRIAAEDLLAYGGHVIPKKVEETNKVSGDIVFRVVYEDRGKESESGGE